MDHGPALGSFSFKKVAQPHVLETFAIRLAGPGTVSVSVETRYCNDTISVTSISAVQIPVNEKSIYSSLTSILGVYSCVSP